MKVFIEVSGGIDNGLNSPTRGEGRWSLNLARVLADAGHEVVMSANGGSCGWGKSQKHPYVNIVNYRNLYLFKGLEFDAFMVASWMPDKIPVRAKKNLMGLYGLGGVTSEPFVSMLKQNDYILSSTMSSYNTCRQELVSKNIEWKDRYRLLCQPYGPKFGDSKFNNKAIVFTAKEVFHHTLKRLHEDARKNIFAAIDACKETNAKLIIVSAEWDKPEYHSTIEKLGIFDKLREISNCKITPIIPWNEHMNELSNGSVFIPLGFAGSTPDALHLGLVPILRKDAMLIWHPNVDVMGLINEMGDSLEKSQEEIKNTLIKLLTDEDYYNHFQKEIQKVMIDHLDGNVLKQFYDIVN